MAGKSVIGPLAQAINAAPARSLTLATVAQGLLQTNALDWYFTDFTSSNHGLQITAAGTGTETLIVTGETSGLGWLKLSTGASGSSLGGYWDQSNGVQTQSRQFYIASRFRMTTVPAVGTLVQLGMRDAGSGMVLGAGVNKASVANNFCIYNAFAAIDTGIAFDTNYHTAEVWGQGGSSAFWRFDSGASTPMTVGTLQTGAGYKYLIAANGATAADQTCIVDWFAMGGGYLP